jgi:transposase
MIYPRHRWSRPNCRDLLIPTARRERAARNIGGLPAHLPRVHITIEPTRMTCPCCEGKLHRIGEDVSEILDVVPAILRVKCTHRPRYGCRACETAVVQAKAPPPGCSSSV